MMFYGGFFYVTKTNTNTVRDVIAFSVALSFKNDLLKQNDLFLLKYTRFFTLLLRKWIKIFVNFCLIQ